MLARFGASWGGRVRDCFALVGESSGWFGASSEGLGAVGEGAGRLRPAIGGRL